MFGSIVYLFKYYFLAPVLACKGSAGALQVTSVLLLLLLIIIILILLLLLLLIIIILVV